MYSNTTSKIWQQYEITPNDLRLLLLDKIKWIKSVWEGDVPTERDAFCKFMNYYDACHNCKNLLFQGYECWNYAFPIPAKSKYLQPLECGWGILSKSNGFTKKDLPPKKAQESEEIFIALSCFYNNLLKELKSNYLTDLFAIKNMNNEIKREVFKLSYGAKISSEPIPEDKYHELKNNWERVQERVILDYAKYQATTVDAPDPYYMDNLEMDNLEDEDDYEDGDDE